MINGHVFYFRLKFLHVLITRHMSTSQSSETIVVGLGMYFDYQA